MFLCRCVVLLLFLQTMLTAVNVSSEVDVYLVRLAGENLEVKCHAEKPLDLRWTFRSVANRTSLITIGHGSSVRSEFSNRSRVDFDASNNTSRLMIADIRQTDAGTYSCQHATKPNDSQHDIRLTVLARAPSCSMNVSSEGQNVSAEIRCQVDYSGHRQPNVQCRELTGNKTLENRHPLKTGNSTNRSQVFIFDVDYLMSNSRFVCTTEFSKNIVIGRPKESDVIYRSSWTWRTDSTSNDVLESVSTQSVLYSTFNNQTDFSATSTKGNISLQFPGHYEESLSAGPDMGTQVLLTIAVVLLAATLLALSTVIYRSASNGVFIWKSQMPCIMVNTTATASTLQSGQHSIEMHSLRGSADEQVCRASYKQGSSRQSTMTYQDAVTAAAGPATTSVYIECIGNNTENDTASDGLVYAELSVSVRSGRPERHSTLQPATDTETSVYADINHTVKTAVKGHRKQNSMY